MSRTNYLENAWLRHFAGEAAFTAPSNLYVALFSDDAGEDGGGTELSGNGYSRQAITLGAVSGNQVAISNAPEFTANGGDWTVKGRAIFDASSGGNMLYTFNLGSAENVVDGNSYRLNTLTITAD